MTVARAVLVLAVGSVLLGGCTGGSAGRASDPEQPSGTSTSEPGPEPTGPTGSTRTTMPDDGPDPTRPVRLSPQEQARLDTRLIAAAWADDVPAARRLIMRGADVNAKDETEQSAYLIATSEGYLRLLELTLTEGANVGSLDGFRGTGLIRAADRGHADVVGRLLQSGIDVDHVNNLGWTALHEAIILGDGSQRYVDTVRALVAGGVDVAIAPVDDGLPPAEHAADRGYVGMAALLREARPVGETRPNADQRLLAAARTGDADAAALAIRDGAELEARDERDRTPLLLAVSHDRIAVARLLVSLGADPDALDDQHDTPWLVTGVTGSVTMAEVLLPADPDLTIRNRYGGVSIIPASERGHVGYVRRVVRTDIDVDHVNDLGWTALLEAVILGDGTRPYQEIVGILVDAGADPSLPDGDGVTALEHAESAGFDEIARILRRADRR